MKYYAKLDEDNIVLSSITLADDIGANEAEDVAYLSRTYGWSKWKRTYSDGTRKNFAGGPDWIYDEASDSFIEARQPYPSWTLDENHDWQPPSPKPDDENTYTWNEETQSWDIVESE